MRIAYVAHWNQGPHSGVLKKIMDMAHYWNEVSNEVALFILVKQGRAADLHEFATRMRLHTFEYKNRFNRLWKYHELVFQALQFSPSIIYYRYQPFLPFYFELSKYVPVVIEINTDDVFEFRKESFLRHLYNYFTRNFVLSKTKGLVFVSGQISQRPHFKRFKKPYIVIGNSIDLSAIPQLPGPANKNPKLVFMGSPGKSWHGLDKIIWLAEKFQNWKFDLIGQDSVGSDKNFANIKCHGQLRKEEYTTILAGADVAIGSLSLHKINIDEASPLKVREYLAFGLPTIIGYADSDFPDGAPFLLQLPNREDNVRRHLKEIEQFVELWSGRRVSRKEIEFLDVSVKEKKRLAFMESLSS